MTKIKGRLIFKQLTSINEGDLVYWDGCPSKVLQWYVRESVDDLNKPVTISPSIMSPRAQSPYLRELSWIMIEYIDKGYEDVLEGDEFVLRPVSYRKHALLNFGQWSHVINNQMVDDNKIYEFDLRISKSMNKNKFPDVGRLTSLKPKTYTEAEMLTAFGMAYNMGQTNYKEKGYTINAEMILGLAEMYLNDINKV